MINLSSQLFTVEATILLVGLFVSFAVLYAINNSTEIKLTSLHVKAGKSPTNAFLLGGLALSLSSIISIFISITIFAKHFSFNENLILKSSLLPIFIITFYGLIDDKFEIRARHKLLLQIISITLFLVPLNTIIFPNNPIGYIGLFIFALAYINGCNLIDGLDTIFVKIGSATSLAFLAISYHYQSLPSMMFSTLIIASLVSFYYYNKEPAKIYAGEIGGSLLGMLLFIQANFLIEKFNSINHQDNLPTKLIATILIVSIYPLAELGITFTRRIIFKKSPFRGDQLHLHHIIKAKYNLKASQIANLLTIIYLSTELISYIVSTIATQSIALYSSVATISTTYSIICFKYWKKSNSKTHLNDIFMNLNEKPIYIVDGKDIDSLYLKQQVASIKAKTNIAA